MTSQTIESQSGVLGLIAGNGELPFIVARGAKAAGLKVICVGIEGSVKPELAEVVDEFKFVPVARLGKWIRFLRRFDVTKTIMVGGVSKQKLFTPFFLLKYRPDWRGLRLLYSRLRKSDLRNDSLLSALADELAIGGVMLDNSVEYCQDHLAPEGVIGTVAPSKRILGDITFGWPIVKEMGRMDIGQSIAVKKKEVIAVEAIEGTDGMIKRAGELCKNGGWVLIKSGKPNQDMRFDVPTVGPGTIENLKQNGGGALAIEAGVTLIIERKEMLALADKYKIIVYGVK